MNMMLPMSQPSPRPTSYYKQAISTMTQYTASQVLEQPCQTSSITHIGFQKVKSNFHRCNLSVLHNTKRWKSESPSDFPTGLGEVDELCKKDQHPGSKLRPAASCLGRFEAGFCEL
jgi:hypothetical protein